MMMDKPVILYEDNHVLVAVKPAGLLSQADVTGSEDMLTLLKKYLCERYNKPGEAYLGLLHRLDRPVSGIMVFAKTSKCASRISMQIRGHRMEKRYRAVVWGEPVKQHDTLTSYILKNQEKNQVSVLPVTSPAEQIMDAKLGVLTYTKTGSQMWESPEGPKRISLLEVNLLTGRSHQIRAQLADEGFPIVGDRKYGPEDSFYRGEICLESFLLSFNHPVSGERMTFELPVSEKEPWNLFR